MTVASVARQPIFDVNFDIYGYELLFREVGASAANVWDGDRATADVLLSTLTDIGLDRVVGDKLAFVNMTRKLLMSDDLACLPPDRIVLEILEDIEPDLTLLESVQSLLADNYTVALDDYVYRAELDPLVDLVHIVKIDLPLTPQHELPDRVATLRQKGKKVLAEKVETYDEFQLCADAGCELFQGYFFCKPHTLSHKKIGNHHAATVRLMSGLQRPDITADEIEELLRPDPNLCFKILRLANSTAVGISRPVESLRHATALIGVPRIRAIASIMLLASIDTDKPKELLRVAMIRARMCELMAERLGDVRPDRAFTAGMLSVFDALLDTPMHEVVETLGLSTEINAALVSHEGPMGAILAAVLQYEAGTLAQLADGIHSPDLVEAYLDAICWAADCCQTL